MFLLFFALFFPYLWGAFSLIARAPVESYCLAQSVLPIQHRCRADMLIRGRGRLLASSGLPTCTRRWLHRGGLAVLEGEEVRARRRRASSSVVLFAGGQEEDRGPLKEKRTKKATGVATKGVLGDIGNTISNLWSATLLVTLLGSMGLAAYSLYQLRTQPITLDTILNILPLAGFGYFGAMRVLGLVTRVLRVIVTIPLLAGGAYLLAPQIPSLIQKSPDVTTGSAALAALLATPELFEAVAVIALIVSIAFWLGKGVLTLPSFIAEVLKDGKDGADSDEDEDEL